MGGTEWIVVGLVVVLLFGAKKLPDLANSMGRSIKEFRKGADDVDSDADDDGESRSQPRATTDEHENKS